ncbi:unnamed protein product (macronuclear) [Paramecium tetraurelia]|uniref:Uncharacterized protein n=1 Tax=Paramecium tetraurelia TaxID=5888 RepID=A0E367_PARTE|nr:uncharacterized protein GSPATT00022907001 [Paramecium tetraurelia]CAK89734.1 unnamed protein product [Paramecium tetraurelia]|eukprot:XP_001457131.1 hypothetical protein (macronuclear) [Paramecium tetraurelia strain d4-2]
MKKRNYEEDIRFKAKQRCQTISEWAFKTIESERVQETRAKSLFSGSIRIQNQLMYSIQQPQKQPKIISSKSIFRKNPRLGLSQKPTSQQSSKIYRKLIDPNQITRSLDYSELEESQANTSKRRVPQNQRLNRQFQAIYNKMKLILDSYNQRERVLLKQIASLQEEIIFLKQTQNQTI